MRNVNFFMWLFADPEAAISGCGWSFAAILACMALYALCTDMPNGKGGTDWAVKLFVVGIFAGGAVACAIWPWWGGIASFIAAGAAFIWCAYLIGKAQMNGNGRRRSW